jgi:pimeloyl-ACP methyl ester carboxylesterase
MPYHFIAHSAGAQLLHRLLLFRPDPSASSIVVANSGSYTFPDLSWDFPYGLRGLPPEFRKGSVLPSLLKAFVEAPLTLAIGTEDVLTTGQHMDMSKVGTVGHGGMRPQVVPREPAYHHSSCSSAHACHPCHARAYVHQ